MPSTSLIPQLCKFWRLYGGVNGNILQEGLCHAQVCGTQSLCPCCSPLLTHTATEDTQAQFCLGLCEVSGSWSAQGLFEPSGRFWCVWGLILNVILPLLPSCWHSPLPLDMGYLLKFAPASQLPLALNCHFNSFKFLSSYNLWVDFTMFLGFPSGLRW